jgi:hypothetical protein
VAEERSHVALAHALDVGLMSVVAADRYAAPVLFRGTNLAEEMVAAELAIGVSGNPA